MKYQRNITFESLKKKISSYITDEKELNLISKAYNFASEKHFGQKRLTGDDYIIHPLNVAYILTSIKADADTLSAALIHDVMEMCGVKESEIERKFGKNIASLVKGVTTINKLNFSGDSEAVINNQRKILVGLSEDVRVIIIKLADRLNNLQTMYVLSPEKQKETAKETLDILVPIASRLGINSIKQDLEEFCLRYLKPDEYYDIVEKLNATKAERDEAVRRMIDAVDEILNKYGIKHETKGRSKSIYSIYKKLDKGKRFSDIYDLLALRIYVDTEQECYQALGIIHSKFKPKPKRFKDYIAMPKTNMYQSLHTTVFGIDGQLYEIQIRTYDMDKVAEYGIASHWSYKEKGSNVKAAMQNDMEKKLQFFRTIMDLKNTEEDPEEFVKTVKEEVFQNTIYVFTPMGDVIELPKGATPVDFAYKVHSNVGDRTSGAIVNSNMVPLDYELHNEDIVKIITNNKGPSREWLKFVKTTQAKNKIKAYFNRVNKEENLKKGEEALVRELKKRKISSADFFDEDNSKKILSELKFNSFEELYIALGSGKILPETVVTANEKEEPSKEERVLEKIGGHESKKVSNGLVSVPGIDEIKVNLAMCCCPIPGDKIIGYITKGYGITIHRIECPNVASLDERLIKAEWNQTNEKVPTNILIKSNLESNVIIDVVSRANNNEITVNSFSNHKMRDSNTLEMTVLVKDREQLNKFITSLEMVNNIISVEREIK